MARATRLVLSSLLVISARAWHDCLPSQCDFCLSAGVHDAPGVGFDLTTGYSTAAVHFYNGSIRDIAKVPTSPEYADLMVRLANSPIPGPPSRLERWRRWFNKMRGLPATPDIGVLSAQFVVLKTAAEAALSQRIDKVAVTTPASGRGLGVDDLDDALSLAGLGNWLAGSAFHPRQITESNAVFAANGHGLCVNYLDIFECWDEEDGWPNHLALFVSFTQHALSVSLHRETAAFPRWPHAGAQLLHVDAGRGQMGRHASPADYWAQVRALLLELPRQAREKNPKAQVDMVLLGGENGTDKHFLTVLRDAMEELSPVGPVDRENLLLPAINSVTLVDPTFAAARGMATYARRRQEVPGDCMEAHYCEKDRETERQWVRNLKRARVELK